MKSGRRRRHREDALDARWAHHHAELRDPHQIVAQWEWSSAIDPDQLRYRVRGRFWEALETAGGAVLVTREYEHLVVALCVTDGRKRVSYLRLPHPNGMTVDPEKGRLFIASTRNPNLVFEFAPAFGSVPRKGLTAPHDLEGALLPLRSWYLPGSLYLHDLALVGGRLHANAVALNAVVELPPEGGFKPVWWPRCIDAREGPRFDRNYLQLNSIAAGPELASSFFSASTASPSARRPGHLNFPVDRRGVIFSGRTRAVIATGLTRPHSARLQGETVWVDNSGYGELGFIQDRRFEPIIRLPGWTRGLGLGRGIAFVGTSRVIPRFRHYAPGLDVERSETGIHAVDLKSGRLLGSLIWPMGNQIFAVEISRGFETIGFPFAGRAGTRRWAIERLFFGATAQANADPGQALRRRARGSPPGPRRRAAGS